MLWFRLYFVPVRFELVVDSRLYFCGHHVLEVHDKLCDFCSFFGPKKIGVFDLKLLGCRFGFVFLWKFVRLGFYDMTVRLLLL